MVGFALIGDFELGCVFVKNHAAYWVSEHYVSRNLMEHSAFLLIMVSGKRNGFITHLTEKNEKRNWLAPVRTGLVEALDR